MSAILFLVTNFIFKFRLLLRHTNGYGLFKCSSEYVTCLGWTGALKNDFEMWTMGGVVCPYHFGAKIDELDHVLSRARFVGVQMDLVFMGHCDSSLSGKSYVK
jgi:hypothetical protein